MAKRRTAKPIPTHVGDVLILRTAHTFTIYAVGPVHEDGQQTITGYAGVVHVTGSSDALTAAKALVKSEGRIFFLDIDADEWFEMLG